MKKILLVYLFILFCGVVYSFGITTYENIRVNSIINNFMKRATYDESKSTAKIKYYMVDNPDALDEYTIFTDDSNKMLGHPGDILAFFGSNFEDNFLAHNFISYYFGLHAALVTGYNEVCEAGAGVDGVVDVINNGLWPKDMEFPDALASRKTGVYKSSNRFLSSGYDTGVSLRVKGITDNERIEITKIADDIVNSNHIYNYFFFINNTNKYYCTSFIEVAFERLKPDNRDDHYNMNYDGFTSCVNDLILSRDIYLTSYYYTDDEGVTHIYYLEGYKEYNY